MRRTLSVEANNGELYGPALEITSQADADDYFEDLVDRQLRWSARYRPLPQRRQEAENHERSNLGYFAGYYSNEVRERVERLFGCVHPIFGSIAQNGPPTPEQAFKMGTDIGQGSPPKIQAQPATRPTIWDRLAKDE